MDQKPMTNEGAIARLQNRDQFLERRIGELEAEGRPTFWFNEDRRAIALAISALEFLDATQQYEASQSNQ